MAEIITVSKKNESFLNLDCEISILHDLKPHFTFFVDGYRHMPKFRAKLWDGQISLLDLRFGTLPAGLYYQLVEVADKLGYKVVPISSQYGNPDDKDNTSIEDIKNFISNLNLSIKNKDLETTKLELRDYQIESIYNCIHNQRQISLIPTGGGKSAVAYVLYRWYLARGLRFMLVVPTLGLIKQIYSDFKEYSLLNGYDLVSNSQIVAEGASKQINKSLIISTWQSCFKQPAKWFNDSIDVILADECLHPDSIVKTPTGGVPIKSLNVGDLVFSYNETTQINEHKPIKKVHKNISLSEKKYKVTLENGDTLIITGNHKILTETGWKETRSLLCGEKVKIHK